MSGPGTAVRALLADLERLEAAVHRVAARVSDARGQARRDRSRADRAERAVSLLREEREVLRRALEEVVRESREPGDGAGAG